MVEHITPNILMCIPDTNTLYELVEQMQLTIRELQWRVGGVTLCKLKAGRWQIDRVDKVTGDVAMRESRSLVVPLDHMLYVYAQLPFLRPCHCLTSETIKLNDGGARLSKSGFGQTIRRLYGVSPKASTISSRGVPGAILSTSPFAT